VTDLFEHFTAGDSIDLPWNQIPFTYSRTGDSGAVSTNSNSDYLLFVHGWRMRPWERRSFAITAFKRLYWQGFKGRYGFFSWPTDWNPVPLTVTFDIQNYDRSERRAYWSARALRRLVIDLNRQYPNQVRLFAHSMGNVVASEMLYLNTRAANSPVLHSYIACQAAMAAHAYDSVGPGNPNADPQFFDTPETYAQFPPTGLPYYLGISNSVVSINGQRRILNYHNFRDVALTGWEINKNLRPDVGWGYSVAVKRFYRGVFGIGPSLNFPWDRQEIYAHIAEPRCAALGAVVRPGYTVNGPILQNIDLNALFAFQNGGHEHSAQFNSTIQRRWEFWARFFSDAQLSR
jgi:hypothetical protein